MFKNPELISNSPAIKKRLPSIPLRVIFGLFLAIILDTIVQVTWKYAVSHVPAEAGPIQIIEETIKQPIFWLTIALFFAQFINWMTVLAKADLSFAQPITALSYISVCTLSVMWLNETVPPTRIIGIVAILVGVWFVSRTEHNTILLNDESDNNTPTTSTKTLL